MIEYNYVRPKKNIKNYHGWIVCYEEELYPIIYIDKESKMYHIDCEEINGFPTAMALKVGDPDFYFLEVAMVDNDGDYYERYNEGVDNNATI